MAGTRKHGLDNEDTEIEVGLNGIYCKRDEENLCQEQNVEMLFKDLKLFVIPI